MYIMEGDTNFTNLHKDREKSENETLKMKGSIGV